MSKYSIGVDFGSLSGRALVVDVQTGEELATSELSYAHAVMTEALPDGTPLGVDWALQHPQDYLDVLVHTITHAIKKSKVDPEDIIGIGIDFTSSTILPVDKTGLPLCFFDAHRSEPHAYVKMWKHHAAQPLAVRMTELAKQRGELFLQRYGGTISSEWALPKVWQMLEEAPHIYDAADYILEANDWIVMQLTGRLTKNNCSAGYKWLWSKEEGYPDAGYLAALHPRLATLVEDKLDYPMVHLGERAGRLTEKMAKTLGLLPGTPVAAANIDAHVTLPSLGLDEPNKLLAIIGTSTCHMVVDKKQTEVPGMCGTVDGGILPGYYGYEAGQSCVGDHFAWFVQQCVPQSYAQDARKQGMDIHQYLTAKAKDLRPGQSGLLALDWWNGNRSVLVDIDLSGMILGMTLQTRPEEIYHALIESTAFGTRMIIENFRAHGVAVDAFYASGGIIHKNPMLGQIYADVVGMPIRLAGSENGPALGSAIFAAVAAGAEAGGYDQLHDAAQNMGKLDDDICYTPITENVELYDQLFAEYQTLHDYFGRDGNHVMKRMKQRRMEQSKQQERTE